MKKNIVNPSLCLALLALSACASNPDNIDAAYVSPLKYASYDCGQLGTEIGYINQRTNTLYSNLAAKRRADNWQMGVGLVLFWPTLFALEGGDGADATEYAQLKGEFEALRQVSTEKRCNLAMRSPDEILNAASQSQPPEAGVAPVNEGALAARLKELEDLRKMELISEDEYNRARTSALGI
ncbi:MAG: hypothetical protein Q7W55_03495 [Pseudohongiella sp.]|nr:hypothetical protein [Pseudohongiella sp.]MDO9521159.1 hypothetical protein [Pseudohongiella sp.]MDP2127385.1 hypothetical protein [Pseudohongiella sp.]